MRASFWICIALINAKPPFLRWQLVMLIKITAESSFLPSFGTTRVVEPQLSGFTHEVFRSWWLPTTYLVARMVVCLLSAIPNRWIEGFCGADLRLICIIQDCKSSFTSAPHLCIFWDMTHKCRFISHTVPFTIYMYIDLCKFALWPQSSIPHNELCGLPNNRNSCFRAGFGHDPNSIRY